jgi:ribosomal protein S18 acetylase RimI-like enzyme
LPFVPEVTFRLGHGADDAAAYVALLQACQQIDGIDPYSTLEHLPSVEAAAASLANLDPQDILVGLAHEHMVGLVRTTWWEEEDGTWLFLHLGRVLPAWRRRGLGTAFVRWAEHRLRDVATTYLTNGKAVFGANASSTETSATALLINEGYAVYYTSAQMEFTAFTRLRQPALPEGFEQRTALPEHYRTIWEAGRRYWAGLSMATNIPTEGDYQEFLSLIAPYPELLVVVWHNEQPVAIAQGRMNNETGIVDDLVVSPEYKRRGLARAAMTALLTALGQRDAKRVRLHTDASNRHGARALYEQLGFQVVKLYPRYRKPLDM